MQCPSTTMIIRKQKAKVDSRAHFYKKEIPRECIPGMGRSTDRKGTEWALFRFQIQKLALKRYIYVHHGNLIMHRALSTTKDYC